MKLKENLELLLESSNLNLSQLSKGTGVPLSTLHGWVNGVSPKNIQQLKSVSDFFSISLDALCFDREETCSNAIEQLAITSLGIFEVFIRKPKERESE